MIPTPSKSEQLYAEIRRALRSGRYLPGQRIDPAGLGREFGISTTPVRSALYRLVGEGLIDDQARAGLRVPLPNELALRELYDWMQRLLSIACDIGISPHAPAPALAPHDPAHTDADVPKRTWTLFDAIARATAHRTLHRTVRLANDRLAPVRRAKQALIADGTGELAALDRHWRQGDLPALASAVHAYHRRRQQLVPCIVAVLGEGRDRLG